jgi:hypothetical protein
MLTSATEHYKRQQRITAAGLVSARRAWARGDMARVVSIVTATQLVAAREAAASVPLMLAEQDISTDAAGEVNARAFAGVASDGRPLDSLLAIPESVGALELIVATQVQDAARGAAGVAVTSRPAATGYVRMLNPPSCSRCAVLAGKFYRWNTGFQRHPRCDCRHVPSSENVAGDLTTNPNEYFDSLSPAEQDKHFTKAGAQAIRDGADISQVVNARRGMSTAQIGGRKALVTTEGTTARGIAGKRLGDLRKSGEKYRRSGRPRVMPETIYDVAADRADAIRLLKVNGFIL